MSRRGSKLAAAPEFDPEHHVSPFTLSRRLADGDRPLLVALKPPSGPTVLGEIFVWPGEDWRPPGDEEVVLFNTGTGTEIAETGALDLARHLRRRGHRRVRALYGGLELYAFVLPRP